ncbi:hypothetical protein BDF20DRAFT_24346 [Mycotypha africana]|uniref:uncharacterized protein n=1 Tax=Mycotypha africana TaxID=64632 RepID=UPI002301D820|nr:uncharacterized protein BDF20DRAFT_24346 [Mycotypha africana]KAI8991128.1 hypothetical protein BDF20DRAFT_24346 [Mycotypha africana]
MAVSEPVNVSRALNQVFHQAKTTANELTNRTESMDPSKKKKMANEEKDTIEPVPNRRLPSGTFPVQIKDELTTASNTDNPSSLDRPNYRRRNSRRSNCDSDPSIEHIPMETLFSENTTASDDTSMMSTIPEIASHTASSHSNNPYHPTRSSSDTLQTSSIAGPSIPEPFSLTTPTNNGHHPLQQSPKPQQTSVKEIQSVII